MPQELILIVDDEENIIELGQLYLENEGYQVEAAYDGLEALRKFESLQPALIVLDLMLPELNGWEVCKKIRATSEVPIIMLTARTDDVDKIVGLELGADDYMTKPYNPRELVARVKAVLRRGGIQARTQATSASDTPKGIEETPAPVLQAGPLTIDPARREARLGDKLLDLRTKEFDLLQTFAENKGLALSREKLLELAWGYDFYGETRTVDVHVAHLRDKINPDQRISIETVWGVGYKFVCDG
jgi:two-component system alkaline phosphatase synthesis response regulator PhoP